MLLLLFCTALVGIAELWSLTILFDWLEEKYPQFFLQEPEDN